MCVKLKTFLLNRCPFFAAQLFGKINLTLPPDKASQISTHTNAETLEELTQNIRVQ